MRHDSVKHVLLLVVSFCAFLSPGPIAAQAGQSPSSSPASPALPPAVREAADGISRHQLAWDVAQLSSDALAGRNTPSPGFDRAAEYIERRLARAGVEPLGDDGGYRQHYELRDTRVDTDGAALETGGRRFRFGEDFLLQSFAGAVEGEFSVVYVGHGWVFPDRGIDPYEGHDVRGRVVLAHGPRVLPRNVELTQIGRVTPNARSPLVEAARRGAAAVLFIPDPRDLIRWDSLRAAGTVRRELEPPVPSAYAAPRVTSLLLAPQLVEALLEGERLAAPEAWGAEQSGAFPPSFVLDKRISLRVPVAATTIRRPFNVVAVIRGSDESLRNEYVTVEAHLDGAVGTRPVDGDDIYNAADDNASGSAALLAIAEQLMQAPRPRRSIVFIWDSGEEQGLWGTRWFVHSPPVPLERIVAHVNVDMIGSSRPAGRDDDDTSSVTERGEVYLIGPGVLSKSADALLQRVNENYLKLRFNRRYDRPESEFFYPRTDAGPFLERGILTIGFFTGLHERYHQPSDEARFLDPVQIHLIARTVLASVWTLADAPERPRIDQEIPSSVPRYGTASAK